MTMFEKTLKKSSSSYKKSHKYCILHGYSSYSLEGNKNYYVHQTEKKNSKKI